MNLTTLDCDDVSFGPESSGWNRVILACSTTYDMGTDGLGGQQRQVHVHLSLYEGIVDNRLASGLCLYATSSSGPPWIHWKRRRKVFFYCTLIIGLPSLFLALSHFDKASLFNQIDNYSPTRSFHPTETLLLFRCKWYPWPMFFSLVNKYFILRKRDSLKCQIGVRIFQIPLRVGRFHPSSSIFICLFVCRCFN